MRRAFLCFGPGKNRLSHICGGQYSIGLGRRSRPYARAVQLNVSAERQFLSSDWALTCRRTCYNRLQRPFETIKEEGMQKTDFIARVAEQTGVSKKTSRQVI